jgi:uncharacterized protein
MNAFIIDAFDFCRQKQERSGELALSDLPRLAAELTDNNGSLQWTVRGGVDGQGHSKLNLSVSGPVHLRCQRCLGPFEFDIDSESVLLLAGDEASADTLEAQLDDDSVDVVVGSRTMDMAALIEDEALLALPVSPRHEICPDQSALDALRKERPDSPFAVLKNLRE